MAQLKNTAVSVDFTDKGYAGAKAAAEAAEKSEGLVDLLLDQTWQQLTVQYVKIGIDTDYDKWPNLTKWEVDIRNEWAIESERKGGSRSKGTGFIMPPIAKSYKSIIRSAVDKGVELLDADGFPRKLADVKSDIKEAREPKTTEEKLLGSLKTYMDLRNSADDSNPLTVDCDNLLVNWLETRGYKVTCLSEAAA